MFHLNGITQYVIQSVWLLSLSRFARGIDGAAPTRALSLLQLAGIPLHGQTTFCLSITWVVSLSGSCD